MKVLAVGAHFDDAELGCGGALARHSAEGDDVTIYTATRSGFSNVASRVLRDADRAYREGLEAARRLSCRLIAGDLETFRVEFDEELNSRLCRVIDDIAPDIVYTHWIHDIHHDHGVVGRSSLHAARHVPRILLYRSNWYQAAQSFNGNFYTDISRYWDIKADAIRAHESEFERGVGERWLAFFKNEALNAGQRIGVRYAEVFEVVKWLV